METNSSLQHRTPPPAEAVTALHNLYNRPGGVEAQAMGQGSLALVAYLATREYVEVSGGPCATRTVRVSDGLGSESYSRQRGQ